MLARSARMMVTVAAALADTWMPRMGTGSAVSPAAANNKAVKGPIHYGERGIYLCRKRDFGIVYLWHSLWVHLRHSLRTS